MAPSVQAWASGVLLLLSVALLAPLFWRRLSAAISRLIPGFDREPVGESSDAPAPPGFARHVELIRDAAQSASAEAREAYYLGAFTRAQTLESEVDRLSRGFEK